MKTLHPDLCVIGGDCLGSGCVPSKFLLSVAKHVDHLRYSDALHYKNQVYDYIHAVLLR